MNSRRPILQKGYVLTINKTSKIIEIFMSRIIYGQFQNLFLKKRKVKIFQKFFDELEIENELKNIFLRFHIS